MPVAASVPGPPAGPAPASRPRRARPGSPRSRRNYRLRGPIRSSDHITLLTEPVRAIARPSCGRRPSPVRRPPHGDPAALRWPFDGCPVVSLPRPNAARSPRLSRPSGPSAAPLPAGHRSFPVHMRRPGTVRLPPDHRPVAMRPPPDPCPASGDRHPTAAPSPPGRRPVAADPRPAPAQSPSGRRFFSAHPPSAARPPRAVPAFPRGSRLR